MRWFGLVLACIVSGCMQFGSPAQPSVANDLAEATTTPAQSPGYSSIITAEVQFVYADEGGEDKWLQMSHGPGPCVHASSNRLLVVDADGEWQMAQMFMAYELGDIDEDRPAGRWCIGDVVAIELDEGNFWKGSIDIYGLENGTKWASIPFEFPERKPPPISIAFNKDSAEGTLTVVQADDVDWSTLRTEGCTLAHDGSSTRVQAGDRLLCEVGAVRIVHVSTGSVVYATTFT